MKLNMKAMLVGALLGVGIVFCMAFDMQDTDKGKQLLNTPTQIGGTEQGLMYKLLTPYVVDQTNSALIYMRYKSGTGSILIVRISSSSTLVTYEKAIDTWANRATATYSPIND